MNAERNTVSGAGQRPAPQRPPMQGQSHLQGGQSPQQRPPMQGQSRPQGGQSPQQRPLMQGQSRPQGGGQPPQRPQMQTTRKKKVNPRHLSRVRAAMLVIGSMILLLGLLLVLLPMFKLQKIEISGIQYYTEEQILEHAGLNIGDEMLSIDLNAIRDSLLKSCPNIDSITIRSVFPSTIKIEIVEKSDVAYLLHNGIYYTFDSNYRVLAQSTDEARFAGFPRVTLPEIVSLKVGEKILFVNPETDMRYVFSLINEMKNAELLAYVTLLDCEQKYYNAIELNGNCRIEVGKISDIPSKLELAQQILVNKGLAQGQCVVLDVSDLNKSTYRLLSRADFLTVG